MAKPQGIGLGPSGFREGGGLLDDVDVKWKECLFEMWDYNGTQPTSSPALKVVMELENDDTAEQYFSAGSAKDWDISDDGKMLIPTGSATGLNKTSNLAILIASLVEAGFPEDKIGADCSVFEGLEAHMVRVPAPKRGGLAKAPRADGKTFEPTNLVVDKITKLPWEGKTGKGKAGAKDTGKAGTSSKTKDEAPETDLDTEAQELVQKILESNPKGLDKKNLASAVFKLVKGQPNANVLVQLVYKEDFLDCPLWDFDKKKGTIKPIE
jgi:hypothetical protein